MSEPSEARRAPDDPARLALQGGALARWLAPTAESRLERIACTTIQQRPWPAPPDPDADLLALTRSIRHRGIVEPLLLRPVTGGRFEVVLGARRLEVARRLQMAEIPAIVRELDGAEAALLAVWNVLPRLGAGEMIEVAARLNAAGVTESEIALLLAAADPGARAGGADRWPLRADLEPLRLAGSTDPVHLMLDALGHDRGSALAALRGVDPTRLAGPTV